LQKDNRRARKRRPYKISDDVGQNHITGCPVGATACCARHENDENRSDVELSNDFLDSGGLLTLLQRRFAGA